MISHRLITFVIDSPFKPQTLAFPMTTACQRNVVGEEKRYLIPLENSDTRHNQERQMKYETFVGVYIFASELS